MLGVLRVPMGWVSFSAVERSERKVGETQATKNIRNTRNEGACRSFVNYVMLEMHMEVETSDGNKTVC